MKIIEIQSAFPDIESATAVIKELLSKKLIACGNIVAAQSIYMWEGNLNHESESVAMMKTSIEIKDLALREIGNHHPYKVPAILSWDIEANEVYGNWVYEMTHQE